MALVFSVTGVLGVVTTLIAFTSRQYRQLSATYAGAPEEDAIPVLQAEGMEGFSALNATDGTDSHQVLPGKGS